MKSIKAEMVARNQINDQTRANTQRQSQNIDEAVDFVVDQGTPGPDPIAFEHKNLF
jgi:hypothetical protein